MLLRHAPGLGAHLQNRKAGGVVNEQRGRRQLARRAGELREVALGQEAVADVTQVHPRARTQHTQHERFGGHFQAEHAHGQLLVNRHMLGDVHGERSFAHRRPRGDDDHFARMQPAGHLVQVGEPGGDAGQHALTVVEILDRGDGILDQVFDGLRLALHARFADLQNVALDFVHQHVHLALELVHAPNDVGAGVDHFPQEKLFLNDVQVVAQVRRARHRIRQRCEIRDAADLFEQLLVLEPLLDGDDVNRLARVVHLGQRGEDSLVPQVVKHFAVGLEFFDAHAHAFVGREQHAAEDALLGRRRMRRQAVHGGTRLRARRFLAAGLFQIGATGAFAGNGINHADTTQEKDGRLKCELFFSADRMFTKTRRKENKKGRHDAGLFPLLVSGLGKSTVSAGSPAPGPGRTWSARPRCGC